MPWLDGTNTGRSASQLEASVRAITNATTSAALQVTQTANASASTSTGGAVNVDNSGSTGAGLVVYSAQASPSGRLIVARANNATFSQTAMYAENSGTGHALHAANTYSGTNTTGSAGNFTSTNPGASCVQISGVETGRGSLKITHTGTGTDASGSALSIDLAGSGTAAQGIFLDATGGGTTGDLMDLRNNAAQLFKVKTNGYLAFGNGGPGIAWGSGSPEGVVTAPVGWIYLRSNGSAGTAVYRKESGTGNTGWTSEAQVTASTQAANYVLALADAGTVVEGTKSTAQTVTVPLNSSVAFPVGTVIEVCQAGAGQITITPATAGVTLRTPSSLTTRAQWSSVGLRKRATDEWVVSGDLT